jgi:hypothetical protein
VILAGANEDEAVLAKRRERQAQRGAVAPHRRAHLLEARQVLPDRTLRRPANVHARLALDVGGEEPRDGVPVHELPIGDGADIQAVERARLGAVDPDRRARAEVHDRGRLQRHR